MGSLQDAISWIKEGQSLGFKRTQAQAAKRFGVKQPNISRAMKNPIRPVNRGMEAVAWMLEGIDLGEVRTQAQAAVKFKTSQPNISLALKAHVISELRPDGRIKCKR